MLGYPPRVDVTPHPVTVEGPPSTASPAAEGSG